MAGSRKKKQRIRWITFLIAALLLIAAGVIIYSILQPKPRFYPGFGIAVPVGYSLIGIDVSVYQGKIFWEDVAAMQDQDHRIDFAFIKATEGESRIDPRFEHNWEAAGKTRISRGAYHYFHPTQSAVAQAMNFLQHTPLKAGDLRPVLDVEITENVSSKSLRDSICKWLTIVGKTFKTAPIIYTNASFYNQYLKGSFDDYPLWIAHYGAVKPAVKTDFQCWQFNDNGRVNGIDAAVDFNVLSGDRIALRSLLLD